MLPSIIKMLSEMYNSVNISGAGYSIIAIDSSQKYDLSDTLFFALLILAVFWTTVYGLVVLFGYGYTI